MADISTIKLPDDSVYNIKDAEARTLLGGHSVGIDVPSDAVFTDTTYENKAAAANGTAVSLVTTGQKAIWNAKANSNTTYTFSGGTNKFTVTPSGGSAQDVTITPSITNNVTGSGTSGYIAKFNGTNTLTNGPQIGTGTTTFLRNDGTWTSNVSAGGYVSTNGKTSVWDSTAGGIMSASGVLSLRANSSTTPGLYVTAYGSTTTTYDAGLYYNSTADRWQSNKQIYAPSFYATGRIDVGTTSVTGSSTIHAITQGREIELISQASGTCGIYDITNSKWLVSISSSGVRGPVASTTENGFMSSTDKTKLNSLDNSVSDVSGQANSIASGTSNVDLLTSGIALAANHKYLFIYAVQWTSNATGRRHAAPYINGTEIGVITTDNQTAINGAVTFNRGVCGITASTSARTLMVKGYQNSGSSLTATVRYQLIDLGT